MVELSKSAFEREHELGQGGRTRDQRSGAKGEDAHEQEWPHDTPAQTQVVPQSSLQSEGQDGRSVLIDFGATVMMGDAGVWPSRFLDPYILGGSGLVGPQHVRGRQTVASVELTARGFEMVVDRVNREALHTRDFLRPHRVQ